MSKLLYFMAEHKHLKLVGPLVIRAAKIYLNGMRLFILHYISYFISSFIEHLKECYMYVIVITQDEYDILVITRVRGETEDECQ